jgi:heme/copper-type cytochrome/quinol oxidase subunit 2
VKEDSIRYDSLESRPMPKWLIDQREGLNSYQPVKAEMRVDNSLNISMISTGVSVILTVLILTLYFLRKSKKRT